MKKLFAILISCAVLTGCEESSSSDVGADPGSAGQGGSLARFAVVNNTLYTVQGRSMKVFDIENPINAREVGSINVGVDVETIFPRDAETIFIGSTSGMLIMNVKDPLSPVELSRYQHVVSCDPVVANEDYAFVTLRSDNQNFCFRNVNRLDVVDISDLRNPELVHTQEMESPRGLGLYGDTLLVCDDGVKVFDVNNATSPLQINKVNGIDAVDIIPNQNLMIISTKTGLKQYRYNSGQLKLLSSL